jgi:hydroxyacylglutathione hydrolase
MIKRLGDVVLIQLSDVDSNIYIIGDTVIDSGTGFNFTRLYSLLKMLKMPLDSFSLVVNTHGHFDHVGGNGYFLKAKVAIHEKDAQILEKGDMEKSKADFFDGKINPRKVDIKLKDGQKLKIGKREFEVIHAPGHTPGCICLYDKKDKLLISGDVVFSDGVGNTDGPGGSDADMDKSLERISKLAVDKIFPGHGEPVMKGGSKIIKEILSSTEEAE